MREDLKIDLAEALKAAGFTSGHELFPGCVIYVGQVAPPDTTSTPPAPAEPDRKADSNG